MRPVERSLIIDLLGAAEKLRMYATHDSSCHSDNLCVCGWQDADAEFADLRKLVYEQIVGRR